MTISSSSYLFMFMPLPVPEGAVDTTDQLADLLVGRWLCSRKSLEMALEKT